MSFDFASLKAQVRQTVHETLGVLAFYQDSSLSKPVEISARWHNKLTLAGDFENNGYAEVLQGIDRVIFMAADSQRIGVKRGGTITFPSLGAGLGVTLGAPLGGDGVSKATFVLHMRQPNCGPIEDVWHVTPQELPR